MQMLADVINIPIRVHRSEQACASGAAMFAATVAGIYPKVEEAMHAMGSGFETEYKPRLPEAGLLQHRYKKFSRLSDLIEEDL